MKNLILLVIFTLLVTVSSCATKQPPKQIIPIQENNQMSGNNSVDSKSDVPSSLSNIGYQAKSTTPEKIAREYLQNHKELFQLEQSQLSELKLSSVRKGLATTTVRFKQYLNEIEVDKGEFSLSYNKTNVVTYVSNNLKPVKNLKKNKLLVTLESAQDIALSHLNNNPKINIKSAAPVIYLNKNKYITVYKIQTLSNSSVGNWLFLINANTGEIIMAKDTLIYKSASNNELDVILFKQHKVKT